MNKAAEPDGGRGPGTAPPFPGLRPFSKRDHEYFFGRERQKYALYLLLTRNHFVSVVGSSGSGKSSIVRAGLLPMLEGENASSGAEVWQYTTMRPGRDPIERLARALAKTAMNETDALFVARRDRIAAVLRASRDGISEALVQHLPGKTTQFVLVVDQFEELFRYLSAGALTDRIETAKRREEATNFVQLLLAATRSYDSRIRVIVTMRSDFIGDCANFQGLPEVVSAAQFLVPSLTRDQREEAICEPIRRSGATIDPELVERLLNDSNEELDQLPVLQHCLARLWMRAGSPEATPTASTDAPTATAAVRNLTERDYKDISGVAGALSGHADEILGSLPGKERTVEQILRALGEIDKDGRATRRPRELAQLIAEAGANREDVCAVLDKFRADDCSFIVPPLSLAPTAELPDDTVIDVGHEALLRRWKRVSGDPEATGERADKRDIGWLRKEQKDGERYQFLRSCVDPESPNESRLSDDQVKRYRAWWENWNPNRAWAARYGGRFEDVDRLIKTSYQARRRAQWTKATGSAIGLIGAAVVAAFVYTSWQRQQLANRAIDVMFASVSRQSTAIRDQFNAGQLSSGGASVLIDTIDTLTKEAIRFNETPDSVAVGTELLLTASDIRWATGDKEMARSIALEATSNARKYLLNDAANRRWMELLYGSLFRLGDVDLDEATSLRRQGSEQASLKYSKQALLEYQESQRIAEQLLSHAVALPQPAQSAGTDYLAKQRFDLAFGINKVGEAMQVEGDLDGAIANYRKALEIAQAIESASKTEWKLQSATTKIKIAGAFMKQVPKNLEGAIQSYSEAIAREEAVSAMSLPSDNIVRSNLAAAYEGRAQMLMEDGKFEAAFKGYQDSVQLFTELTEVDSRNTEWLERLARARSRFGAALEEYARARGQPLDKAIEQYNGEVSAREKLVQRAPANASWQKNLQESRSRLQRVQASPATDASEKPLVAQ